MVQNVYVTQTFSKLWLPKDLFMRQQFKITYIKKKEYCFICFLQNATKPVTQNDPSSRQLSFVSRVYS